MPKASAPQTADQVMAALADASDDGRAEQTRRFFRTGPGEYAEHDVFIGVEVPAQRRIARTFAQLPQGEIDALLWNEVHEHRMTALLIMVEQYRAGQRREELIAAYLDAARAERIDNWDLVDASAEYLLGDWLRDKPPGELFRLAKSDVLWERRIAIVATHAFVKAGDGELALELAERLMRERTDLIQKAVGWTLREVGKRVSTDALLAFLDAHAADLGATALSYATEHLDAASRERYRMLRKAGR